jgi:hypothetical protein
VNSHFASSRHRAIAGYQRELEKQQNRLREALAREEALRHQNDELIQQQRVLSALLASREGAAECVARLLAAAAPDYGIGPRRPPQQEYCRGSRQANAPSRTTAPQS